MQRCSHIPGLPDLKRPGCPASVASAYGTILPIFSLYVNPSTPRPEGQGLLRVDPERRFFTPSSKAELGAVEWVKLHSDVPGTQKKGPTLRTARMDPSLASICAAKIKQRFRRASLLYPPHPSPLRYTLPPKALTVYIWGDRSRRG